VYKNISWITLVLLIKKSGTLLKNGGPEHVLLLYQYRTLIFKKAKIRIFGYFSFCSMICYSVCNAISKSGLQSQFGSLVQKLRRAKVHSNVYYENEEIPSHVVQFKNNDF
jgi:hypothetical protein